MFFFLYLFLSSSKNPVLLQPASETSLRNKQNKPNKWNHFNEYPPQCNTLQSVPSAPPQEVKCSSPSSTSILVSWRPPPVELQNGIITKYSIKYAAVEGEDTSTRQISDVPPESSQYLLENLEKWTEYRVTVSAHTDVGPGPESLPQLTRTDEDGTSRQLLLLTLTCCGPWSFSL